MAYNAISNDHERSVDADVLLATGGDLADVSRRSIANLFAATPLPPSEHPETLDELADAIERSTARARDMAARHVNVGQLLTYWNNGRMIVTYEQGGRDRAEYGDKTLTKLARRLTDRLGRGFSRANLYNMRQLYLTHRNFQTLSVKLTFSHYCELLDLADDEKRAFYEHEAENAGWSVRELRRQMDSMLFERILNARDDARREHVLALADEGSPTSGRRTPCATPSCSSSSTSPMTWCRSSATCRRRSSRRSSGSCSSWGAASCSLADNLDREDATRSEQVREP